MSFEKYQKIFYLSSVILLVITLLLGVFFRFANLESKVFWVDEVSTAVRASGYTIPEVTNDLIQQGIVDRKTLFSYQRPSPDKTFRDSFNALTKSPEHAPLYFLLIRVWMQLWGDSISIIRSFSACISLLVFPSLYWLCQELFDRRLVSWLAIMLMSVSPFHVAYAQEARPYSLWTVAILLMSASFLRAIKLNNKQSWILYSFSLIIGFYTSLFSLYVAFFQGIYFLLILSKKRLQVSKNYVLFSLISLVAFIPWILVIINNIDLLHKNTSWMRGNFNIPDIIAVFIGTDLLIFGDLPISQNSNPIHTAIALITITISTLVVIKVSSSWKKKPAKFALWLAIISSIFLLSSYMYLDWITIIGALVALCILSLSVYSVYYLIVNTKRDRWLFIITLMLSLPVSLLLTDIINQGQSSTAPRYLIPLQLGILIAVAYTLTSKITAIQRQNFWRFVVVAFLTLGIFSCARNLNLSPFYQKGRNINNPAIAQIINQNDSALVIAEYSSTMDAFSLAYSLSPQVKYKVINQGGNLDEYIKNFENIYVLKPSLQLKQKLKNNRQINFKQVYKSHIFSADEFPLDLWSVKQVKI
ncbi:glycosyltransferase family 39 protein [Pleurocapsa sp. FMAR1]|uniref:glycosyltransferase family 39 protein n=1 Tax=Pleurocapsa sp. FMAR1 TaxID=3040204 RepID=UPI0029C99E21|nr:glycosyltransferase family 39 protein [Pleurocapsa sp. FMAR1]